MQSNDSNNNKKKPTTLYRSPNGRFTITFRWWSGKGLIVLAAVIAVILFARSQARLCSHEGLDNFLAQVQNRGGMLVQCENRVCRDVKTGDLVGRAADGMYIVYLDNTVSEEEMQEQSRTVRRLMRDEQRECGIN